MIECVMHDLDGSCDKRVFKYDYDETGNWVKKIAFTEFENNIPEIITEREIEYYE